MGLDDATEKAGEQERDFHLQEEKGQLKVKQGRFNYWQVQGQLLLIADCINIGYFIQWIRDNQWITLSNLIMLFSLDNPLYKIVFYLNNQLFEIYPKR